MTVPHLPHKTDLKMWSAVDRDGCFVKLSRSINFVPPEVCHTVDGRNPAPVDRWFIPSFIGFQPSKVVQDFFHSSIYIYMHIILYHTCSFWYHVIKCTHSISPMDRWPGQAAPAQQHPVHQVRPWKFKNPKNWGYESWLVDSCFLIGFIFEVFFTWFYWFIFGYYSHVLDAFSEKHRWGFTIQTSWPIASSNPKKNVESWQFPAILSFFCIFFVPGVDTFNTPGLLIQCSGGFMCFHDRFRPLESL